MTALVRCSILEVEAALCVWEHLLGFRDHSAELTQAWDWYGTVHMRHEAIHLGVQIEEHFAKWELEDYRNRDALGERGHPYDWVVVPALVEAATIEAGGILYLDYETAKRVLDTLATTDDYPCRV